MGRFRQVSSNFDEVCRGVEDFADSSGRREHSGSIVADMARR
jgi:hypothetical protein